MAPCNAWPPGCERQTILDHNIIHSTLVPSIGIQNNQVQPRTTVRQRDTFWLFASLRPPPRLVLLSNRTRSGRPPRDTGSCAGKSCARCAGRPGAGSSRTTRPAAGSLSEPSSAGRTDGRRCTYHDLVLGVVEVGGIPSAHRQPRGRAHTATALTPGRSSCPRSPRAYRAPSRSTPRYPRSSRARRPSRRPP